MHHGCGNGQRKIKSTRGCREGATNGCTPWADKQIYQIVNYFQAHRHGVNWPFNSESQRYPFMIVCQYTFSASTAPPPRLTPPNSSISTHRFHYPISLSKGKESRNTSTLTNQVHTLFTHHNNPHTNRKLFCTKEFTTKNPFSQTVTALQSISQTQHIHVSIYHCPVLHYLNILKIRHSDGLTADV